MCRDVTALPSLFVTSSTTQMTQEPTTTAVQTTSGENENFCFCLASSSPVCFILWKGSELSSIFWSSSQFPPLNCYVCRTNVVPPLSLSPALISLSLPPSRPPFLSPPLSLSLSHSLLLDVLCVPAGGCADEYGSCAGADCTIDLVRRVCCATCRSSVVTTTTTTKYPTSGLFSCLFAPVI